MAIGNLDVGIAKPLSATANVKSGQGAMLGVLCTSTTSGTLTFYDSATTTTTNPLTGTLTLTAGQYYPIPATFADGLYVVLANTATFTVFYV